MPQYTSIVTLLAVPDSFWTVAAETPARGITVAKTELVNAWNSQRTALPLRRLSLRAAFRQDVG